MRKESDVCHGGNTDICLCPLEGIVAVISKKWALQIIAEIGNHGKLRFNEILARLGKISPKALTDRLKELETAGLVKREAFAEIPPRVEYSLTKDGLELRKLIIPIMKWASSR
ncbi:MAG: helix-turn-helix transcriptional regulator [Candidatus Bathyarchaeota archaeon]|nr:helix-turn-helix transcriptional regulator [Candidatus Bathyarchaeota archaeon]